MTEEEIKAKLKDIITQYLPEDVKADEITPEKNLTQGLGINSSHLIDIVLDVEDAFDIRVENEDIEQMRTVGDAIAVVRSKVS